MKNHMNYLEIPDTRLIERTLAGDADAFAHLTERYRPMVFALCLQWTRNPADAADLAQDTLLRAYLRLDQIRDPDRFGPWLAQVAVNLCKNWRTRGRQDWLPLTAVEQTSGETDLTQGIMLRTAMASLSPELRQVIQWFYLEGFSQQDQIGRAYSAAWQLSMHGADRQTQHYAAWNGR